MVFPNNSLLNVWLGAGAWLPQINTIRLKRRLQILMRVAYTAQQMYFMGGLLEGKPNALQDTSYVSLKPQDGYSIRIKTIKLSNNVHFPGTSRINADGVRHFMNDKGNGVIYIGRAGLEGVTTFHEVDFETPDGYYLGERRNCTINRVIGDLHNLRIKVKKGQNQTQIVTNLLTNPMYGETVIKPVETDTVVQDSKEELKNYTFHN